MGMKEFCLYPAERLAALDRLERRAWLELSGGVAAGAILCAAGLLLRAEALSVLGPAVAAWSAYYVGDARLRPARADVAFVRRLTGGAARTFDCRWLTLEETPVYVEGVRARIAHVEQEGAARSFYVRAGDALPEIGRGQNVRIEAVDRFIRKIQMKECGGTEV